MRQENALAMQQQEESHAQIIMSVRDDAARTQEAALEHAATVAEKERIEQDKAAAAQLAEAVTKTEAALRALHEKITMDVGDSVVPMPKAEKPPEKLLVPDINELLGRQLGEGTR